MAEGANSAARDRAESLEAGKARRQKIFIAVGGVALLGLVGFQLPGLFGSSSGSGSSSAPPSAGVAVAIAPRTSAAAGGSGSAIPRSIAHLAAQDVFKPQVSATTGGAAAVVAVTLKGPAVRTKGFVVKDVFIPQIIPPAASAATSATITGSGDTGSTGSGSGTTAGAGYIIVVASISGIGSDSQKAAARALVAAKNAGLKDVSASNAVPGQSGSSAHFTVFTGPYSTEAEAQTELVRALRNGYPRAHAQALPASSGKGF